MVPSSAERVPTHTAEEVNRRIRQETESRIAYYADHPEQIDRRLGELDREWDIERAIEANASTLALAGVALGVTSDRRWLALPALVSGFLLQHAIQGWCPPVPILRRLGFRTAREIEQERYALMALRGDFDELEKGASRLDRVVQVVGLRKLFRPSGSAQAGEG
ncbi:YgaP family membrane protein [Pseudaminobacter sp. NGMCC 1.201702]|uniref:YgaP family membrane protein n=1 Tax=Pseudaminobacter sp. NGMCC 1.201702 TaxID=3391825 RepID=UPI0039F0B292